MPLVVHSPYSGKPVKVRDEDVSRAIRDEEGRIFYVVERSDGQGYYASPTRQGSEKDEQRYLRMLEKSEAVEQHKKATIATAVHDATGSRGTNVRGKLVRALVALVLLLALIYIVLGYTGNLPEGVPNILPGVTPPEDVDAPVGRLMLDEFTGEVVVEWRDPGPAASPTIALTLSFDAHPALESSSSAPMSGAGRSEWPINC